MKTQSTLEHPAEHHGLATHCHWSTYGSNRRSPFNMAAKASKILVNFARFCAARSFALNARRACSSYGKTGIFPDYFCPLNVDIFGVTLCWDDRSGKVFRDKMILCTFMCFVRRWKLGIVMILKSNLTYIKVNQASQQWTARKSLNSVNFAMNSGISMVLSKHFTRWIGSECS